MGGFEEHAVLLRNAIRRGERLLERCEEQREGRAKLVADVAEEIRLGLIELRQRLRALALDLEGLRVR
jgi:hypothetical protein